MHPLRFLRPASWLIAALMLLLLLALAILDQREKAAAANANIFSSSPRHPENVAPGAYSRAGWRDSFGDGWPDAARLKNPTDRENFIRWMTYLAESLYYQPAPHTRDEVRDCAALIRYAYRNALAAHTPAWYAASGLHGGPGFADVIEFSYPDWPLGRELFRTLPGPLAHDDLARGAFQEFADAKTLMRFNTFVVSRDIRAARAGDLLFFRQPEQTEPLHAMLFVGRSYFQPKGNDWIVYHTGDLDGRPGEIRHVEAVVLAQHPEPRWQPFEANPRFLGVYRFNLLR